MAKYKVTAEELRNAAKKFDQYIAEYESACSTAQTSANDLTSKWEGDAQKAFTEEQQRTFQWYKEMAEIVKTYARAMEATAAAYDAADAAAAAAMKG